MDRDGHQIPLKTTKTDPLELIIPRDPFLVIPPMYLYNVMQMHGNDTKVDQVKLFSFHSVDLRRMPTSVSLHFEVRPLISNLSYLFVYRFDRSALQQIDGWKLFCPSLDMTNQTHYTHFIDNEHTASHPEVIFGLRELNLKETEMFCSNASIRELPVVTARVLFTSNFELRLYTSSCLYFDDTIGQWKSDGMKVGPLTNHYQTHCLFTH